VWALPTHPKIITSIPLPPLILRARSARKIEGFRKMASMLFLEELLTVMRAGIACSHHHEQFVCQVVFRIYEGKESPHKLSAKSKRRRKKVGNLSLV